MKFFLFTLDPNLCLLGSFIISLIFMLRDSAANPFPVNTLMLEQYKF